MNVPTIAQGPGSVATLPGPQTAGAVPVASEPESAAAFARVAWFDLNGDGHIDDRNPMVGGDGTLIVPAHALDAPTYSRSARRAEVQFGDVGAAAKALASRARVTTGGAASDVATQRVIDAYQRYGQSSGDTAAGGTPKDRAVA